MGLFGGGGEMDFGFSKDMVNRSYNVQRTLYDDLMAKMAPYNAMGAPATRELSNLLGLTRNKQELLDDPNIKKSFTQGSKGDNRGFGYWDKSNPDTWTWMLNGKASGDLTFDNKGYQAEIENQLSNQGQGEGFGSLLDEFSLEDYQESPNYQFNLAEGEKAINRAAAARGDFLSPEAVQELSKYSQNLASNEYLNSYNMDAQNKGRTYDMLMGSVGVGQNSINQMTPVTGALAGAAVDRDSQLSQLNLAEQAAKAQKRGSTFGKLASVAGTAIGGYFGGPMGAQIGGQLGSAAGSYF